MNCFSNRAGSNACMQRLINQLIMDNQKAPWRVGAQQSAPWSLPMWRKKETGTRQSPLLFRSFFVFSSSLLAVPLCYLYFKELNKFINLLIQIKCKYLIRCSSFLATTFIRQLLKEDIQNLRYILYNMYR